MATKQAPQRYADGGMTQPGQPSLAIQYADGGSLDGGGRGPFTGDLNSKTTTFNQDYLRGPTFGGHSYAGLINYPGPAPVTVSPPANSPQQSGNRGDGTGKVSPITEANLNMVAMDPGLQAIHDQTSNAVMGAFTGAMMPGPIALAANLANLATTGKPMPGVFDAIKGIMNESNAIDNFATGNPDKAIQAGYLPEQYLNFSDLFNGITVGDRNARVNQLKEDSLKMAEETDANKPTGDENQQAVEDAINQQGITPAPDVNPTEAAAGLKGMEAEPGPKGDTTTGNNSGNTTGGPPADGGGTTAAMAGGFGDTAKGDSSGGEADGGLQLPTGVAQASGNFIPNQQSQQPGLQMPQQAGSPTAPADPMHPAIAALHVQNTLANPQQLALIKQHIQQAVDSGKANPQQLQIMGQLAQAAMQHPEIWPKLRQFAIQAGVAGPNDLPPTFNQGLCMLLVTVAQAAQHGDQQGAFANGGMLHGPGTGISDSIPAQNKDTGQHIKLSNGEYVIPADVVATKGREFFDNIVRKYHTPAALQRRQ